MSKFNAVRVFSATMVHDRELLGETITEWLAANPKIEVVDRVVTQSSDQTFHCVAISLFLSVPKGVEIVDLARSSRPDMRRRVS